MKDFLTRFLPLFDQEGGGGSGAGGTEGGSNGAGGEGGSNGGSEGDNGGEGAGEGSKDDMISKEEVQKQIDAAVKKRLKEEKIRNDRAFNDFKKSLSGEEGKEGKGDDGGDNNSNGNDEATRKAEALVAKANQTLIDSSAMTEAIKLGADPKHVSDAVRLADLSKIEVGEDGTIDTKEISKALDDVLKRVPAFKTQQQEGSSGFRVGGEGNQGNGNGQSNGWNKKQDQGTPSKRWNRWN